MLWSIITGFVFVLFLNILAQYFLIRPIREYQEHIQSEINKIKEATRRSEQILDDQLLNNLTTENVYGIVSSIQDKLDRISKHLKIE